MPYGKLLHAALHGFLAKAHSTESRGTAPAALRPLALQARGPVSGTSAVGYLAFWTPRRSAPVFADASGAASRRANPRALDLPPIKPAATLRSCLIRAKFIAALHAIAATQRRVLLRVTAGFTPSLEAHRLHP